MAHTGTQQGHSQEAGRRRGWLRPWLLAAILMAILIPANLLFDYRYKTSNDDAIAQYHMQRALDRNARNAASVVENAYQREVYRSDENTAPPAQQYAQDALNAGRPFTRIVDRQGREYWQWTDAAGGRAWLNFTAMTGRAGTPGFARFAPFVDIRGPDIQVEDYLNPAALKAFQIVSNIRLITCLAFFMFWPVQGLRWATTNELKFVQRARKANILLLIAFITLFLSLPNPVFGWSWSDAMFHGIFGLIAVAFSALALGKSLLALRRISRLTLCRQCNYDLTGNASGICPECGTRIPPEQVSRLPVVVSI